MIAWNKSPEAYIPYRRAINKLFVFFFFSFFSVNPECLYKYSLLQSKDWIARNRHYVSPAFWQGAPTVDAQNTGLNRNETLALRVSSIREHLRNKRPKTDGHPTNHPDKFMPDDRVGWKRSPWSFRRPIVEPILPSLYSEYETWSRGARTGAG